MAAAGTYVNLHLDRRRTDDPTDAQPLRLLVVDDDADYRAYIVALTRRVGFVVETVPDGPAAIEALAIGNYDAAAIDQEMPRMTGIELIARVRAIEETRSIYAVMLTGHEDMNTKIAALHAGFDDFVAKSSAEVEIMAKLAAARRVAARQRTMDVAVRELYGLATRDELTGLFNRRFFMAEVDRMLMQGVPVSVILFDLDDFKQVNDRYGHLAGDRVLRDVGALFHRSTRPQDIVARFGGDELVMAVPLLDLQDVERIAARLSRDMHALRWDVDGGELTVGISTGIASSRLLLQPTLPQILNAADGDMYKNKWLRKHPEPPAADPPAEAAPGADVVRAFRPRIA
jgi:two-component system, cell cycle response regulator